MNKKLLGFLAILVLGIFTFVLRYENVEGFVAEWEACTNDSTWMPFTNYGNRVENASKLTKLNATYVVFEDNSLFWKGQGAVAVPKLNGEGELERLIITASGSGYGPVVTARIDGAGASQFELGNVMVRDGRIKGVAVVKTGRWYDTPRTFFDGDKLPYSGTTEIKYRNGQPMERRQYLEGELHGKWSKWKYNGIPLFERGYEYGLKHGTHMSWYGNPVDPKDYKSASEDTAKRKKKIYVSLWAEVNEAAEEEFEGDHPSPKKLNEWVIEKYKSEGGTFGQQLLEHYEKNQRHGLFEGYDKKGNKIFKDEYEDGKRTKHKN